MNTRFVGSILIGVEESGPGEAAGAAAVRPRLRVDRVANRRRCSDSNRFSI
jgi:hypothetical protein